MEEEVEEEYKAAATVDSRRACPSGCPRAVRGGVTATRRQAALGREGTKSTMMELLHVGLVVGLPGFKGRTTSVRRSADPVGL